MQDSQDSSNERPILENRKSSSSLSLSSSSRPEIARGLVFTAYGLSNTHVLNCEIRSSSLRLGLFPNITGYLEPTSQFSKFPPEPNTRYRIVITQNPITKKNHNFFKAEVLRPLVRTEPTSYGFLDPEMFYRMASIAYNQDIDPAMHSQSVIEDLRHLRTIDYRTLEHWLP